MHLFQFHDLFRRGNALSGITSLERISRENQMQTSTKSAC